MTRAAEAANYQDTSTTQDAADDISEMGHERAMKHLRKAPFLHMTTTEEEARSDDAD